MFKSLTSVTFGLLFSLSVFSQEAFEKHPTDQIKTITFSDDSNQLGFPVVKLGSTFSNASCENTERENSNPKVTDVKDLNMFLLFQLFLYS